MQTTRDFVEAVRAKHGNCSYYRLARILGVSEQALTRYRKGAGGFSREIAIRVADELELPHAYVIACIELERESSEEVKPVWTEIARHFGGKAAGILLAMIAAFGAAPDARASAKPVFSTQAPAPAALPSNVYYVEFWIS